MILTSLCTWTPAMGNGLCYLKSKRENMTPDPYYISGSKKCRLPEWSQERLRNHQTPIFRKRNHLIPRFNSAFRNGNHQILRFRANKRKHNRKIPRFYTGFRNGNYQTPRFRFDKRKHNHEIPRFSPGFRNGNHRTLKFKANKRKRKCKNNDKYCEQWSRLGDCNHKVYGPYMKKYCKLSCNLCTR